ncbi:2-phospho-L-lactate guanylyltransferase [Nostocoides australiense Ben110]|uniref:Phosphoenolpyruvate guanylyltransferase n=1 Tax=Nostocoides australiense Ben110 TaxID=1193182 RepID=W6JZB2_9MICO|nr:2-phospho-L-lactate guanylyltransferase [Tetrasphaera australiensis Ben110]
MISSINVVPCGPVDAEPSRWSIVIPFKGTASAKSRLGPGHNGPGLAKAFLLDVLAAVHGSPAVARVVVVSANAAIGSQAAVDVLSDTGGGLNESVQAGVGWMRCRAPRSPVAVVLADLPSLRSHEVTQALALASQHPRAFVPDSTGFGTTMITLAPSVDFAARFGSQSAAAHFAAGFVRVEVPSSSGLRRDVDTPQDLASLLCPGINTTAFLRGDDCRG